MSFFNDCLSELEISKLDTIKLMAVSVRGSRVEKFEEFLQSLEPKRASIENDDSLHRKNMEMLGKL
jgi:hypothetical protein